MYRLFVKRCIDLFFALLLLLITLPLFIAIAFLLYSTGKTTNILFRQMRPGKNGKIFSIYKFKTMTDEKNENGELLSDKKRLTKVGKFIRSTSLDELPQLINVIKGDMSFIGPRPLLVEYLSLYDIQQSRRHEVRPGITGWAQVNGRNAISWKKKFELDVWYVDNISFTLDFKIFLLTIKKVLVREGISSAKNVTMEAFNGNN